MPYGDNDDGLEQVTNVQSSGGRATTPQMKRHNTPQRSGSAPRSSSASKGKRLEKMSYEVQSCNKPLRSTSRRKLRKWENDNLLGLRTILKYAANRTLVIDGDEDDDENDGHVQINWQSMFGELTSFGNEEALHAYLKCSQSFCNDTPKTQSKTLFDCVNEWDRADFSWSMIEKRLRTVALRAISNPDTQSLVSVVEDILLESVACEVTCTTIMDYEILDEVKHLFAGPIKLSPHKASGTGTMTDSVQRSNATLIITLIDSPFHRILLHTVCQFHGRHSKSFHDKKTGVRSTKINLFNSQKCRHSLSLVPFLLCKILDKPGSTTVEDARPLSDPSLTPGADRHGDKFDSLSVHIEPRLDDERYVLVSGDLPS